nr:MAG TPA: hypothetical protein [Caudoviricetes sp.]
MNCGFALKFSIGTMKHGGAAGVPSISVRNLATNTTLVIHRIGHRYRRWRGSVQTSSILEVLPVSLTISGYARYPCIRVASAIVIFAQDDLANSLRFERCQRDTHSINSDKHVLCCLHVCPFHVRSVMLQALNNWFQAFFGNSAHGLSSQRHSAHFQLSNPLLCGFPLDAQPTNRKHQAFIFSVAVFGIFLFGFQLIQQRQHVASFNEHIRVEVIDRFRCG